VNPHNGTWARFKAWLRKPATTPGEAPAFPDGHFYSPVVDRNVLRRRRDEIWAPRDSLPGVDFNDSSHREILTREFPRFMRDFDYPDQPVGSKTTPEGYFLDNSQFSWLDARVLFVMLRSLSPRRMIEVGSGFSSLLSADVNERFLAGRMDFRCIEPYPRPFLANGFDGLTELIVSPVEALPIETFEALQAGDVLFIDSSHVSKTGSDVNYLILEVLPRLNPGVVIHIHDIFLPNEYKEEWVLEEGRSWNEQYLVQALLIHSSGFEVVFGSNYAYQRFPTAVRQALALPGGQAFGGGSLWIRRTNAGG
jgi:predicted O-methyltransferase YrrM